MAAIFTSGNCTKTNVHLTLGVAVETPSAEVAVAINSSLPIYSVARLSTRQSSKLRKEVVKDARKADKAAVDSALATALGWMADGGPRSEVKRTIDSIKHIHKTMPLGPERLEKLETLRNETAGKRAAPAGSANERRTSMDSVGSERYGYWGRPRTSGRTEVDPKGTDQLLDMFNDNGAFIKSTTIGVGGGWYACSLGQLGVATQTRPTGERRLALTGSATLGLGMGAIVEVSRHKMADSNVRDHLPSVHYDWPDMTHIALGGGAIVQGSMLGDMFPEGEKREHGVIAGGGAIFTMGRPAVTIPLMKISPSLSPIREALGIELSAVKEMPEAVLQKAMEEKLAAAMPQLSEMSEKQEIDEKRAARVRPRAALKTQFKVGTKRVRATFKSVAERLKFAPKPPAYRLEASHAATLVLPEVPSTEPGYDEKKQATAYAVEV